MGLQLIRRPKRFRRADALQAQARAGDPEREGIVWPHVAEISLLGGLRCGGQLLRRAASGQDRHERQVHRCQLVPHRGERREATLAAAALPETLRCAGM